MVENRPVAPIFYGVARTKEDALLDIGRFNVLHVRRLGWRPRLPDQQYLHAQEKTALGMPNGHGVETPANKIATAQAVLVLAFRLNAEVLSGRIGPEIFKREVTVITGGTGVSVPAFSEGTSQDHAYPVDTQDADLGRRWPQDASEGPLARERIDPLATVQQRRRPHPGSVSQAWLRMFDLGANRIGMRQSTTCRHANSRNNSMNYRN